MTQHRARMAIAVLTFAILPLAPAQADPIQITQGSLSGRFVVTVELAAPEESFFLTGTGDAVGGLFGPWRCLPCAPGSLQTLNSRWVGSDFRGQAVIDGTTYVFPSGDLGPHASVEFLGTWLAPAFGGGLTASVTNPFLFNGVFTYPFDPALPGARTEQLFGHGLATVNLFWLESIGAWNFTGATYTFSPEQIDPIPEPATMMLTGAGLAIIARRLRRRRPARE